MAYYIKVRKHVAEALGVLPLRNVTSDGSVLLWQADANRTGIPVLVDAVAAMGGVLLSPKDAHDEMDGTQCRQMPAPTDARYLTTEMTPEEEGDPLEEEEILFDDDAVEGLDE